MTEHYEHPLLSPTDEAPAQTTLAAGADNAQAAEGRPDGTPRMEEAPASEHGNQGVSVPTSPTAEEAVAAGTHPEGLDASGGPADQRWHAEAGRKGARRVHQLIQEGRLYEQEHGLKSGRQRLRQLIELGKLYEQEHGLRPAPRKRRNGRLDRVEREELLAMLLGCLLRIAKPSFRAELVRLVEALQEVQGGRAA